MIRQDLTMLVRKGLAALDDDDIRTARRLFEEAGRHQTTPVISSCLGYCLALEEGDLDKAIDMCREAMRQEPINPLHALNLGRVYLLTGNKPLAVKTFRKGLRFARHQRLIDELQGMGMRRPTFFPSLSRDHVLNQTCGKIFSRLGIRGYLHHPEKFREHHH